MQPRRRHAVGLAVAMAVVLAGRGVAAEPLGHLKPWACKTASGADLTLPPGWHYEQAERDAIDLELRRAQDRETLLAAENRSLRDSAGRGSVGWGTVVVIVGAFIAGATTAIYLTH